ncbi:MAG: STAS/SEC14 domain-containing protein [Cytophagaceae bacterium]|nr:STAS/SEC14 domain-containing protein [Cytophagaceae bacterium]
MIAIVEGKENLIFTHASGNITREDYKKIIPALEDKIVHFSKVRWYFEMDDTHKWEPGAVWQDLKFDLKSGRRIEKIAIVGASKSESFLTKLLKPLIKGEVKFFNYEDRDAARLWIAK